MKRSVQSYDVVGMTCDHCARSVRTRIGEIGGVQAVAVDLASGVVTITSDGGVSYDTVATAVDDAGYRLAG